MVVGTAGLCRNGHDLAVLGRTNDGDCCLVCKRDAYRRYHANHRTKVAAYNASPKARAGRKRYAASPAGKAVQRRAEARYEATPKGRLAKKRRDARYHATVGGQLVAAKGALRAHMNKTISRIAELEGILQYANT